MKKKKTHNGFTTPEGYLEGFTKILLHKITSEEEINIPKKEGFTTPNTYFNTLNTTILKQVKPIEKKSIISLKPLKKYYYAAAIVTLLIFAITWQLNTSKAYTFEDITSAEITTYFNTYTIGLNSYEIAEIINTEALEINDFYTNKLNEEDIIGYLEDTMNNEELNTEHDE